MQFILELRHSRIIAHHTVTLQTFMLFFNPDACELVGYQFLTSSRVETLQMY